MSATRDPFCVKRVTVFKPSVRVGHGIGLRMSGTKDAGFTLSPGRDKLYVDVHGNFWGALPPGASSVASWMLPYEVPNYSVRMPTSSSLSTQGELSFGLAEDKLSHTTLLGIIKKMIDRGNPPILVELWYETPGQPRKRLAQGVVEPSELFGKFHLPQPGNVLSSISPDLVPRRSNPLRSALKALRWMLFPTLFLVLCWSMLFYPPHQTPFSPYAPTAIRWVMNTNFSVDFRSVMPIYPTKMTQTFEVGRIFGALEYADPAMIPELLRQAAQVLGTDYISLEQLSAVPSVLYDVEQSQGLVTRILGFFTLINMIWLLALGGIAVSIVPTALVLIRPISRLAVVIAKAIVERVIIPTARFLHEWGFFEMALWLVTVGLFLESVEIQSPTVGFYITLTALAMVAPALWMSTFLYGLHVVKHLSYDSRKQLANGYIALVCVPLAIYYNSLLLSFTATLTIYGILGFSTACYGLCYVVGFNSEDAMLRVAVTSFLLLSISTGIKMAWGNPWWMEAFRAPISIVGSLTLYLACLIYASYWSGHSTKTWLKRQTPMVISLILGQVAGLTVLSQTGLSNTATVFMVMYILEKACDLHSHKKWNGWVLIFFLSCVGYYSALRLHANPEIVANMFDF